jgi:hypothetical protein
VQAEEAKLRRGLREIAAEHIRWGRRMAHGVRGREAVLLTTGGHAPPTARFGGTADGRRLKFLNVSDDHSRLCLAIRVDWRCKAMDLVAVLEELTSLYPAPAFIRSDNGQAFNCFADASRLRPRPEAVVQEQRHHYRLHGARITVAERLCGILQQPIQGRVSEHRAVLHSGRITGLG